PLCIPATSIWARKSASGHALSEILYQQEVTLAPVTQFVFGRPCLWIQAESAVATVENANTHDRPAVIDGPSVNQLARKSQSACPRTLKAAKHPYLKYGFSPTKKARRPPTACHE